MIQTTKIRLNKHGRKYQAVFTAWQTHRPRYRYDVTIDGDTEAAVRQKVAEFLTVPVSENSPIS